MEEKTIASDYIFKIIAVGNASVGKTSLTLRFATDNFQDDYKMTLGMNLVTKNVQLNSYSIQLAIWDTGGQDSFAPLLPMYYRGALGALVVYDLTNEKSFQSVQKWMNDIKRYCDEIPVVL
ncbi:MAG: Rab family GTPase, partial [Candidatus Kariarchaeaceae archaeon]